MIKTENVHEGCISRASLIEEVERRMERREAANNDWDWHTLNDLLTHLRGEEKRCCGNIGGKDIHWRDCPGPQSGIQEETECRDYPCEKHKFGHKPRTEQKIDSPSVPSDWVEIEKEGASFSGREIKIDPDLFKEAEFKVTVGVSGIRKVQECDCWLCAEITETLPRPKEPPTPQSREQGGEKCDETCPWFSNNGSWGGGREFWEQMEKRHERHLKTNQ